MRLERKRRCLKSGKVFFQLMHPFRVSYASQWMDLLPGESSLPVHFMTFSSLEDMSTTYLLIDRPSISEMKGLPSSIWSPNFTFVSLPVRGFGRR